MGHDSLHNVYKTNFGLKEHHGWDLEYLDRLMPWERYVYVQLLQDYMEEQERIRRQQEQEMQSRLRAQRRK